MNSEIDEMLRDPLLEVPDGFAARVLERVSAEPAPSWQVRSERPRPVPLWQRVLRWLALASGLVLGGAQLVAFMLGFWLTATAG